MSKDQTAQPAVIRLSPSSYIHVLDNNSNVTKVICGPLTFTRQDHEKLVLGPNELVAIPPMHFVVVQNPAARDKEGNIIHTKAGEIKLRYGDSEVRLEQEPFPLYPGEKIKQDVTPLVVVKQNTALRLRADRDCEYNGAKYLAGDEFLCEGPRTYIPQVEVTVVETIQASIVMPNQALKLVARKDCTDRSGKHRKAGEQWIHREQGSYLPGVDEQVTQTVKAFVLTDRNALHLRATRTFTDVMSKERKAGEEWLVTNKIAETHIPDIYEEVLGKVELTTLTSRQYCVVMDPWAGDKQCLGQKELRKGEMSFFLQPGESLERGIQEIFCLEAEEALLLLAKESFEDETANVKRGPGDRWMIYGPRDYVPPVQVDVMERRRAIPLDENEGVYVRDFTTGKVRKVVNETFKLLPNEELWEKQLPPVVERLLSQDVMTNRTARAQASSGGDASTARDKTRVVTFRVPHNAAVQIYDYRDKKARVVFGPDLVMLGPEEEFTTMSLSGDKPKTPGVIKSLALLLGPDFMTDIVSVETADHARLSLQLSYNWHFEVDKTSAVDAAKIFQVPDFVGDSCKAIASRVRGAVASVPFDDFHKNSAKIIRRAVFGEDATNGKIGMRFFFEANNLVITNVDIQSVEPTDQRTRDSLQKSVQLAIEITTKSQEAAAKHEAERREQAAKGKLERQKIEDEAAAEDQRRTLLELQAQSAAVESTGQAKAEATARAEAAQIEGRAAVEQSRLKAEAMKIESENDIEQLRLRHENEVTHQRALNELEINKARELGEIEASKFKRTVEALGSETICAIARAGPEMQAKLLGALNLSGMLITDGNSPINLFSTAQGLLGGPAGAGGMPGMPAPGPR